MSIVFFDDVGSVWKICPAVEFVHPLAEGQDGSQLWILYWSHWQKWVPLREATAPDVAAAVKLKHLTGWQRQLYEELHRRHE